MRISLTTLIGVASIQRLIFLEVSAITRQTTLDGFIKY